jgi:hypothetical protein
MHHRTYPVFDGYVMAMEAVNALTCWVLKRNPAIYSYCAGAASYATCSNTPHLT